MPLWRELSYEEVVHPNDPEMFIHVSPDDTGTQLREMMKVLPCTLDDLGLTVSTGRVVHFRATQYLREEPGQDTVPLIWPTHFRDGRIEWPKPGKKPNALFSGKPTADLLVPNGNYVLVRRFSAKEEKRRVVAAVYEANGADAVGFENHLNYYHREGRGIELAVARGLAAYLNSTFVDSFFRQFNGHTQVNATDLRSIRYPESEQLKRLSPIGNSDPDAIDDLLEQELGIGFAPCAVE
jgi:adenine-specific DNA-methyltransferase